MPFSAGQRLAASQLNRVQPVTYTATQSGNGGGQQTLTTTSTDSLNATVTFTSLTAAICTVHANFDFQPITGGNSICLGNLLVDGVTQNGEAHLHGGITDLRVTVGQNWRFTLSGAGSHTVKLQISKTAAAGNLVSNDNHTKFTLVAYEVV